MILMPVLVVDSEYSVVDASCPCLGGGIGALVRSDWQGTIAAWTVAGIIALGSGALFAALARLRRFTSSILVFAALVYWSGFFNFEAISHLTFSRSDPAFFSWPPVLVIAGVILAWVSEARRVLSKGFWMSLTGALSERLSHRILFSV